MKKTIITYAIGALYLASIVCAVLLLFSKKTTSPEKILQSRIVPVAGDAIAVINISGPIRMGSRPRAFLSYDSEAILRRLRNTSSRKDVKAIVLRINSPGGSVAAVQEIYSEVMKIRAEKKKPVVASFGDVAASGGYYIASACDKIVANPGTITGSIGVLLELGNVQELFKKIGVRMETIKSGKHKDTGSMFRELSVDERKMFQELVNEAFNQFINDIVRGRGMQREKVEALADGRIYTGSQAVQNGLVDKLGNDQTAIETAKELAGISGEPRIIGEYDVWEQFLQIFNPPKSLSPIDELVSKQKLRFEYMLE
ncbi:MAG: signal peptide peptidase SppA [Elusimicrobia bacterium]|nr:signal peptide peptidase SppA [Elusimicrobiota bacterium]